MKNIFLLLTIHLVFSQAFAQEIDTALPNFDRIKISPHINLVLTQGDNEHLRLEYSGVNESEINYRVKGKTLEIFLDGAKVSDRTVKVRGADYNYSESYYKGAQITAYVTYNELRAMDIRGEGRAECENTISADKFRLKIYGENKVELAGLNSENFKTKMYGENQLHIESGKAKKQKFKLYGENTVDTKHLGGSIAGITSFGENKLNLDVKDKVNVFGLGKVDLVYSGNTLNRKFIIGESRTVSSNY